MREGEAARAGAPSVSRRGKSSAKSNAPFVERRRVPRPKFAEIRRGPVSISCRRAWWRARCVSSSSCSSPCSASPSTVTPRLTCRRPTPVLSPPLSFEGGHFIMHARSACDARSRHEIKARAIPRHARKQICAALLALHQHVALGKLANRLRRHAEKLCHPTGGDGFGLVHANESKRATQPLPASCRTAWRVRRW